MGADVIKVEDTGRGDYARPALRRIVNRNKRAIQIDLKHADGAAVFRKLAARADILIESFRPGVLKRLGLDYAARRPANPRLVYCSITGYGQTGPARRLPGHDLNFCAYAGVVDDTGRPGEPPSLSGFLLATSSEER